MKPNVTAVPVRLKRATKIQTTSHKNNHNKNTGKRDFSEI